MKISRRWFMAGLALTGAAVQEKLALNKELPALLA